MATFEVTLTDGMTECRVEADAYQQEGPFTTFFCAESGRRTLDAWATRLASFRSSEILMVKRLADPSSGEPPGDGSGEAADVSESSAQLLDLVASRA